MPNKENKEITEMNEKLRNLKNKVRVCRYDKGYINQEVYAWETCYQEKERDQLTKEVNQFGRTADPAGFCIACLVSCHHEHEVYEIYKKSNFRCDCGNLKFNRECRLNNEKDGLNNKNKYTHNYFGKYCHWKEEYNGEDLMYQCTFWEDWFHPEWMDPNLEEEIEKLEEEEKDKLEEDRISWKLMCRNWHKKFGYLKCLGEIKMTEEEKEKNEGKSKEDLDEGTTMTKNESQKEISSESKEKDLDVPGVKRPFSKISNEGKFKDTESDWTESENPESKKKLEKEEKCDPEKQIGIHQKDEEKKDIHAKDIIFKGPIENITWKCK